MKTRYARQIREGIEQARRDIAFTDEVSKIEDKDLVAALTKVYTATNYCPTSELSKRAYQRVIEHEHQKIQNTISDVKKYIEGHG